MIEGQYYPGPLGFRIISQEVDFTLMIGGSDPIEFNAILNRLMEIFGAFTISNQGFTIPALQRHSRDAITRIIEILKSVKNKQLRNNLVSMKQSFGKIEIDEYYFVFPLCFSIDSNEHLNIEKELAYINNSGTFFNESELDQYFFKILDSYNIKAYGHRETIIGNKGKRTCRFCGKKYPKTCFKETAHSFPEGIGNKLITTRDECDTCNHIYNDKYDAHFSRLHQVSMAAHEVRGKSGVPKIESETISLENVNGRLLLVDKTNAINSFDNQPDSIKINVIPGFSNRDLYKALCRYAINVMHNDELSNFSDTIKWINNELPFTLLPSIFLNTKMPFQIDPAIALYLRKNNDESLPYAVCEFKFLHFLYAFIVPKNDKEAIYFSDASNFETFFKFFKHYTELYKNFQKITPDDSLVRLTYFFKKHEAQP